MIAFLCALINVFILLVCIIEKRRFYYPLIILNTMWLLVNVLNTVLEWESNELEYLILVLPPLMFSLGFRFSENVTIYIRKKSKMRTSNKQYVIGSLNRRISNTIFIIVFIVFLFYLYSFLSRLDRYGGINRWLALRRINWDENIEENLIFKYTSVLAFLLPSILLISARKSKNKYEVLRFIISLAIAIIWSILRTSRTSTFTVIIILVFSQFTQENQGAKAINRIGKRKQRRIFLVATAFILIMFVYIAQQKNGDIYGEVSPVTFFLKSISNYTNLSAAAFVKWYKNGFVYTKGAHSFRFIYALLSRFGIGGLTVNANSGGLFIEYSGLLTNALTVARAYVEDFGICYLAFIMTIFGIIHGSVYKRIRGGNALRSMKYSLINAMLCIPLFFQILTNQYLNVLSAWIQYVLWICLFTSEFMWVKLDSEM